MPKTKKKDGVEQIVAKAFAHPLRVQILIILNERVASPNLLSQELDQSLNLVAYHVRVLEKYDCIELVDTKQRRGATEHFYRATRRQFLSDSEWARMPESLRPGPLRRDAEIGLRRHRGGGRKPGPSTSSRTATSAARRWSSTNRAGATSPSLLERHARPRAGDPGRSLGTDRRAASEPGMLSKVQMLHFKSPDPGEPRRTPSRRTAAAE